HSCAGARQPGADRDRHRPLQAPERRLRPPRGRCGDLRRHGLPEGHGPHGRRDRTHGRRRARSEEHTSELQSRRDLVCCLLLEKKKKKKSKKKERWKKRERGRNYITEHE